MIKKQFTAFDKIKALMLGIALPLLLALLIHNIFGITLETEATTLRKAKINVACKNNGGALNDTTTASSVDCRNGKVVLYRTLYGDEVLEEYDRLRKEFKK